MRCRWVARSRVAQPEPRLPPQAVHRLEAVEGVVLDPPAPLRVEEPREGVGDGVEVGGDAEAPPVEVVAGVADDEQARRVGHPRRGRGGAWRPRFLRRGRRSPPPAPPALALRVGHRDGVGAGAAPDVKARPGPPAKGGGRKASGMGTNPRRTQTRSSPCGRVKRVSRGSARARSTSGETSWAATSRGSAPAGGSTTTGPWTKPCAPWRSQRTPPMVRPAASASQASSSGPGSGAKAPANWNSRRTAGAPLWQGR